MTGFSCLLLYTQVKFSVFHVDHTNSCIYMCVYIYTHLTMNPCMCMYMYIYVHVCVYTKMFTETLFMILKNINQE